VSDTEQLGITRRKAIRGAAGLGIGAAALISLNSMASAQDATPTTGNIGSVPTLTVDGAITVLQAAMAKAKSIGVPEVVAVVDAAGDLKAFARMDGSFNTSIDLAIDKAFTAASFHAPTDQFAKAVSADAATMASILKEPHISLLPGGIPLMSGQTVVGAIGCSGGSGDQDVACSQAGVEALGS
jgi:glc operon protein GlcG